ncbi:MAG: TonB-dependent receptor, partial [Calditrichota bacterium]
MPAANTLNDVHSNSTKFSTKKLYSLFLLFILQSLILHAQSLQDATLIGRVTISENEGLAGVNVFIDSLTIGTATDSDGYFELKNIPSGNHIITFSAIGYKEETRSLSFQRRERKTIIVNLTQTAVDIDEVEVTGRKQAAVISTDAVQATVLQAEEVYKQAVATQDYLRRTSGVHIRQQGGLGSETAVNLNGLTGNAIRIYYDGVPLEYFGGGIELNNFPVSLIRRVEVYKGIMPIAIGSDALGGGINLIPRTVYNDFLEVSHEAGAFNTHRSTLLYRKSMNSTTVLGSNVFFNYSDNDYIMKDISTNTFEIEENIFGRLDTTLVEKVVDAKRFHNR